jgi:uncharacterized protein GlcG (DUF336 family)
VLKGIQEKENVMITLNDARNVIAAAEKKAAEIGQPQNIAVVDAGGNLISHVRMDGAWIGSIDISINKALKVDYNSITILNYRPVIRGTTFIIVMTQNSNACFKNFEEK